MNKNLIAGLLTFALITGCASKTVLSDNQIMQQFPILEQANGLLDTAQADNLEFYSPEQIRAAKLAYDNAYKQAQAGKESANSTAKETVDRVNAAIKQANKAKYVLAEVFMARNKALNVDADSLVADNFSAADQQLSKMLAWLELGEDDRAKRDINQLKNQYLNIELAALKTNMLSVAKEALASAKKQDLDDVTPLIMAQARDEYQLALDTLEADRSDTNKANVHANRTIWLLKRAQGIAEINQYFENADFSEEQKILWFQEQIENALSPVMGLLAFNQPNKELIVDINQALNEKVNEIEMLAQENTGLQTQLENLQISSKNKESQLSRDKEEALLSSQMQLQQEQQAKREDDARFAGVQSLFLEQEATVYRQLDNVLIRAQGFSFKIGSSEIDSSNFALLNKIIDAISRFPDSKIMVSGHTDATGSAGLNLELSTARAQTVASFLNQVGNIDKSRIESQGFGKEKPVASNETAEGRAQNRRVEILIIN